MAYVGARPSSNFRVAPTKDTFTGDGSTTTFDLANKVPAGGENALQVFVENVRQEPGSGKAYTLGADGSGDLKRITFSSAPVASAEIYVITTFSNEAFAKIEDLKGSEFVLDADGDTSITADTDDTIDIKIGGSDIFQLTSSKLDINGKELVLDADADTSIHSDTDDQIDIKIAGADDFRFTANTFTILSGSTIQNSGTASGFVSASDYTTNKSHAGDGSTTVFALGVSSRAVNDVLVFVNGICLVPTDDYTISGTTLTFQTAPASSAEITFRFLPLV